MSIELQTTIASLLGNGIGHLPGMGAGVAAGDQQVADLIKSLTANNAYGTDTAAFTGGAALGIQSLDKVLYSTLQKENDFKLWNRLTNGGRATNLVDEYSRQTGLGGFIGQSANTDVGTIRAATGSYAREIGYVKFFMQRRDLSIVLQQVNNIVDPEVREEQNCILSLLTDLEHFCFNGNSSVCPVEFDGVFTLVDKGVTAGQVPDTHVIDLNGKAMDSQEQIAQMATNIGNLGTFGRLTDIYMPPSVQYDLNMKLDPAFRWVPGNGNTPMLGGHVGAVNTQTGPVNCNTDVFMLDGDFHPNMKPLEASFSAVATANDAYKPSIAINAASSDASSRFTASRAGNYYWGVAGIGPTGQGMSTVAITAQTAVATGKKAVLTITRSTGGAETGYAIFRSAQDGAGTAADLRLVAVVPCAGATTTFTDVNHKLPGTTKVACLDLRPGDAAIDWRSFAAMQKLPLPAGISGALVKSWYQWTAGYLRAPNVRRLGYVTNVLPSKALWRPHTGE